MQVAESVTAPVYAKRSAETGVIVPDGKTVVIGGLMEDQDTELTRKIPFLGDIPILGTLFRSSSYQEKKTDLLIAVTPHIVTPVREGDISYPGEFVKPPSRMEFYLEGRLEGRRTAEDPSLLSQHSFITEAAIDGGGMEGDFGHTKTNQ